VLPLRDTGIADRLRAAGLAVVEIDGWKERGSSSFNPRGGVDHHTAGSNNGNAPSLNICIHGRSDLPGPLCNTLQGFDGTQYVIASGTANHAGSGSWKGLSGNSSVYGMERENDGYSAPRPNQHELAARAWRAIIDGSPNGPLSPDMVCGHKEWAPGRKPDFHDLDYNWFRDEIRHTQHPTVGKDQMFAIIRYPNGMCWRWNGVNRVPIPNPTMLGGDQIMLTVLGMDPTIWNVDPLWGDTFPEALDARLYWNSVVTAQEVGVPQDHIA
jgi:hypothetical protein